MQKSKWKFSKQWEEKIRAIVKDEIQKIEASRDVIRQREKSSDG